MTPRIGHLSSLIVALAVAVSCLAAHAPAADAAPRFFAPDGIWNQPLPADAPIDPDSANYVRELMRQSAPMSQGGYGSSIATTSYGVPIYTVGPDQPMVHVKLDQAGSPLLAAAFQSVPVPANAQPAAGSDGNMAVWQPSTDTMWEFWRMTKKADGWHAGFGGKKSNVSKDPGVYREVLGPDGTSLVERCFWGAPSSKFPLVAGVITIPELQAGVIPHALMVTVHEARAGAWTAPAQATDGKSTLPYAIPMGARFRLDPTLDIDKLNVPQVVKVLARAVQKYGMLVGNQSGGVGFRAEDPAQYGSNPYPALFGNTMPSLLMRQFPWSKLQMMPLTLRSGSCVTNP